MEHSLQGKTGNIPAKVKRRTTSDRVATGEESHNERYSNPFQERAAKRRRLSNEMLSHESKPLENTRGARIKELERPKSDEDGNFTPENDTLNPNHHLSVLRCLVQHMKEPHFLRNWHKDYAKLAESKGAGGIETTIIQGLNKSLRPLVETGQLDLQSLRACNGLKPKHSARPGVYIHVMYHPKDPTIVGIYIGQAMKMGARISDHEKDLEVVKNLRKPRRRKGKPRNHTRHIKFWHQGGIHDFWLVFGQFDRPTTRDGLEQLGLFLNILEMYAALILQSLSRTLLRLNLPENADIGPYPWEGLNALDPMRQPLNHLGQSNGRSKPHWRPFVIHKAKGEGSLWRHADTSKGDKPRVDLVCSHCFNPHSHYTDHDP
jgi:hypothetical protein